MSNQFNQGKTVKIVMSGITRGDIGNEAWCRGLLNYICRTIHMTPISGPHSVRFVDIFGDVSKDGVSAVLIIAESHIAIHTWSSLRSVRILVDSCADFDGDLLAEELNRLLRPENIQFEMV